MLAAALKAIAVEGHECAAVDWPAAQVYRDMEMVRITCRAEASDLLPEEDLGKTAVELTLTDSFNNLIVRHLDICPQDGQFLSTDFMYEELPDAFEGGMVLQITMQRKASSPNI